MFRELMLDVAALVWPVACIGCGLADRELCRPCREEFLASTETRDVEPHPLAHGVWAASGPYDGVRRDLIVALKHTGKLGFVRELGTALAAPLAVVLAEAQEPALLVPVPSRRKAVRERGYRPLELVARAALRRHGSTFRHRPRIVRALAPLAGRTSQVGLTDRERLHNAARLRVRGSMRAGVSGRAVVLIDDVITTGASLAAADRVLTLAGARVVGACAIASVAKVNRESPQK